MISAKTFSEEHILLLQKRYKGIDPAIAEKMIYALSLVEQLAATGLPFVFKGGTSLVLLLNEPLRLSVDIDIVCSESRQDIESSLKQVCDDSHFLRWELDDHRSYRSGVPKAHYLIYYHPDFRDRENHIMLDILFGASAYPKTIFIPIQTNWIVLDHEPISVLVPSIESIVGDKLTAFAPLTTGILYESNKSIEILKQLFDLWNLYSRINDLEIVKDSFIAHATNEIQYRQLENLTPDDVLRDSIKAGLLIASRGVGLSTIELKRYGVIQNGLSRMKGFLIGRSFRMDEAITASSMVGLLASKIFMNDMTKLPKYDSGFDINNFTIDRDEYSYLNKRLRKLSGGALYYWHNAFNILENI